MRLDRKALKIACPAFGFLISDTQHSNHRGLAWR